MTLIITYCRFLLISGFLIIPLTTQCQDQIVTTIEFLGNTKTKEYVIKREIHHKIGIPVDSAMIMEDHDRLINLGIFDQVMWKVMNHQDNSVKIQFIFIESWRYFPGIFPAYYEDTGWSLYGVLAISNFRGSNQFFATNTSIGGRNTVSIYISDPWIFGNHVSMDVSLANTGFKHPFLGVEQKISSASVFIGRYYGEYLKGKMGVGYNHLTFIEQNSDILNYNFQQATLALSWDTRDIYLNPGKGVLFKHKLELNRHPEKLKSYLFLSESISFYQSISRHKNPLIIGFNLTYEAIINHQEEYWIKYLGGGYTVRGWPSPDNTVYTNEKNDYRFGYILGFGSIELRKTTDFDIFKLFKNEIGISGVWFFDYGIAKWKSSNSVPIQGTGFGIRIPFPGAGMVRLDYGWGYKNLKLYGSAFHLAVGQKF